MYLFWLWSTPMFELLHALDPPFRGNTGSAFPLALQQLFADLVPVLHPVALLAAATLAVGLLSRTSALVSLLCFLALYNTYFRVTKSHVEWPYWVFVLLVLCFAHAGDRWSVDAWLRRRAGRRVRRQPGAYRWPVEAVVFWVAVAYVSAGVAKLFPLPAGLDWLSGNMSHRLAVEFYFDSPVHWLLGRPLFDYDLHWPFVVASFATLLTEFSGGLLLVSRRFYLPVLAAIGGFHFIFYVLSGVNAFLFSFVACAPFFIPPEWFPDCGRDTGAEEEDVPLTEPEPARS